MKPSEIRTNLEMDSVTSSVAENDTTGEKTITPSTAVTKTNIESINGIANDPGHSSSDQSEGKINTPQVNSQFQMSRTTSLGNTTCKSHPLSANPLLIPLEINHVTNGGSVFCNKVEEAGLNPVSIAVSSEPTKPTDFKGNIFIIWLHLNISIKQ